MNAARAPDARGRDFSPATWSKKRRRPFDAAPRFVWSFLVAKNCLKK
jgi:hypothetical protein